jgi:hypothetical protein
MSPHEALQRLAVFPSDERLKQLAIGRLRALPQEGGSP